MSFSSVSSQLISESESFFLEVFADRHQSSQSLQSSQQSSFNLITATHSDYICWTKKTADDFENWWRKTQWDIDIIEKKKNHVSMQWNSRSWKTDVWNLFDEMTNKHDEKPSVMCSVCHLILTHSAPSDDETTIMKWHFQSKICQSLRKVFRRQSTIISAMNIKVRVLFYCNTNF